MEGPAKFEQLVNQSGFPLQIGVDKLVQATAKQHGWQVLYTEHSWKNQLDETSGFVDLVLENGPQTAVLVVECKRVREASWIFLNPSERVLDRRHAKAWVTRHTRGSFTCFDWHDLALDPSSPQSQYCVVPGQDAKSRPMLERVAAELVSATEAIAWEEKPLQPLRLDALRVYFSVIVTTAALKICSFGPDQVSLKDGTISSSSFSDAFVVRFRKQLSTRGVDALRLPRGQSPVSAKEHTVFVVNSESIVQFLSELEIDNNSFFGLA
jgi:hypothetical protein